MSVYPRNCSIDFDMSGNDVVDTHMQSALNSVAEDRRTMANQAGNQDDGID